VDTSSANNDNGGFYNASNHPNAFAFATLQADPSALRAAKAPSVE
jgi:hypothetical protein